MLTLNPTVAASAVINDTGLTLTQSGLYSIPQNQLHSQAVPPQTGVRRGYFAQVKLY